MSVNNTDTRYRAVCLNRISMRTIMPDLIDIRLWWHNLWLPMRERRIRREMLPEWIREGRDPADFPRAGKMTREAYDWAIGVLDKTRDHQ
jgi:hypothetical protein